MDVLVTGGAGFIGSNLVERLIVEGHNVTVLDNLSTGSLSNLEAFRGEVRFTQDSCLNIGEAAPRGVGAVFHLGMPSSSPMYKANPSLVGETVSEAVAVFEYARRHNVGKVVVASSSSLYSGQPPPHHESQPIKVSDYYTETRLTVERLAELYSKLHRLNIVVLRFFSVYGPREEAKGKYANIISQFIWALQKGEMPLIYGNGTQTRDFIHVRDVVEACMLALNYRGSFDIFNVGTGKAYTFNHVVELLNGKMNLNVKPEYVIPNPIGNYVEHTLADTRKAEKKLGFKAEISLEEGIDELLRFYSTQK
ncbi:MAG: NAD-dependent epimerase/dehydratase family protein [Candidatus Bathyarchaeia archaeon]